MKNLNQIEMSLTKLRLLSMEILEDEKEETRNQKHDFSTYKRISNQQDINTGGAPKK